MTSMEDEKNYCLGSKISSTNFNIPQPIAILRHESTHTNIYVYKKINWFQRFMLNLCFGLKYSEI